MKVENPMMEYKPYRGHRRRERFRSVCQTLALVGLLVALAAGGADVAVSLGACAVPLAVGLAMFAVFGYLGGLFC